jgi:chemotaxis signal transduction protein
MSEDAKKKIEMSESHEPEPSDPTNGNTADSGVIDLDAFLAELSARLMTANAPIPLQAQIPIEPVESMQVIVFTLNGTRYGLAMRYIGEVLRGPEITYVPGDLPNWVLGVTNLHGEIVSAVDLARFLELGALSTRLADHMMIVAQATDQQIGLIVDSVELIYSFPLDQVLSPPFKVDESIVPYLHGAVEREEEFIRLLDCEQLLLGQQMQQFA